MSITCYTGFPGAGKSYEVVKNVILPAFINGRRIVTNIDGVDNDKFVQYVQKNCPTSCCGQIVVCTRDDIKSPSFYPVRQDDAFSFVRPGDLVVIDEAQNFYYKMPNENTAVFVREHRHFCDAAGRGCDLVLVHQSIRDVHQFIRDAVETSYRMVQNKHFGSKRTYRVFVYAGAQKYQINLLTRSYEKWVFDLYKSFSVSGGFQANVDKRQNVFNARFFFLLALLIVCMTVAVKTLLSFFSAGKTKPPRSVPVAAAPSGGVAVPQPVKRPDGYSHRWRILGTVGVGTSRFVVVGDKDGMIRFEHPQDFSGYGSRMIGKIDGETVTKFTGEFEKKDDRGLKL